LETNSLVIEFVPGYRAARGSPLQLVSDDRGQHGYGSTPPGAAKACPRTSRLTPDEIDEVVRIIASGRLGHRAVALPQRLQTRNWESVTSVMLALDSKLGWESVGWKVGAASEEVRCSEGLPSPIPGRLYRRGLFPSGSVLPTDLFINYRNCEAEFAFRLRLPFPARDAPYAERDAEDGVECLLPVVEVGDMVFCDWYGASAYFGSCLDNGGGAALVYGEEIRNFRDLDLSGTKVDIYLNGNHIRSGDGTRAMGNPMTSLTWLINWLCDHGRSLEPGDLISTGTCTGHLFANQGDFVRADFALLGAVEVSFADT